MPSKIDSYRSAHGDTVFLKSRFLSPRQAYNKVNAANDYRDDNELIPAAVVARAVDAVLRSRRACGRALQLISAAVNTPLTLTETDRALLRRAIPLFFGAPITLLAPAPAPAAPPPEGRARSNAQLGGAAPFRAPAWTAARADAAGPMAPRVSQHRRPPPPPAPPMVFFGAADLNEVRAKIMTLTQYVNTPIYIIDSGPLKRTTSDPRVTWQRGNEPKVLSPTILGYVSGNPAKQTGQQPIHINFEIFKGAEKWMRYAAALHVLHESSHAACMTEDAAYYHQTDVFHRKTLTQLKNNADSYAHFILSVAEGKVTDQEEYLNTMRSLAVAFTTDANGKGFVKV